VENSFTVIESSSIFKNKDVLDSGYKLTIKDILHRQKEIDTYMQHLSWAMKKNVPGNLFIYGKMGTGKTLITKTILSYLEQEAAKIDTRVKSVYINCGAFSTNMQVFRYLNNCLMGEINTGKTKTANSFDAYFLKFIDLMKGFNGIYIIVLDEIDMLDDPDIINLLARIKENGYLDMNVCVIGITNDITFDQTLDARTRSALAQTEIIFSPYNANQLRDILKCRADMAFVSNVLQDGVIPLCSALAAQEHGDARRALELLKVSGIIAVENKDSEIRETHVKLANERIERDKVNELIHTLPSQSKIILLSCLFNEIQGKPVSYTGDLYIIYKRFAQELGIDVLTQRRITDLLSELSAVGLINAVEISKGRFGRTKEVTLQIPLQSALDVLLTDFRLKNLPLEFFTRRS
jgi:cell division control protein 6